MLLHFKVEHIIELLIKMAKGDNVWIKLASNGGFSDAFINKTDFKSRTAYQDSTRKRY